MNDQDNNFNILFVDDNDDDFEIIHEAFQKIGNAKKLQRAVDFDDLINIIFQNDRTTLRNPLIGLVILNLKMPKKRGLEVLREIKRNESTLHLPVVMLSESSDKELITESYELGANSFIKKPGKFQDLVEVLELLAIYWLSTVKLPKAGKIN